MDFGVIGYGYWGPNIARNLSSLERAKVHTMSRSINLYGCEIGDETKIGAFVEIQKNARIGRRCKISGHSFICESVEIQDGEIGLGFLIATVRGISRPATRESIQFHRREQMHRLRETLTLKLDVRHHKLVSPPRITEVR
jgi:carbonic anhydrase/acetyltransferase-like protein (isoleucine patch superfamily)